MPIFSLKGHFGSGEATDLARARRAPPAPKELVHEYTARFRSSGLDREAFEATFAALTDDTRLKSADITAIAQHYARGKRPRSRAGGLAAIRKRFVEIVRSDAIRRNAEKARPW
jgi:hypothetical protein